MKRYAFQNAPRCTATSKRTGERCKAPAVQGWSVCRFHGARGGAPAKHGRYTKRAIAERRLLSQLLHRVRDHVRRVNAGERRG